MKFAKFNAPKAHYFCSSFLLKIAEKCVFVVVFRPLVSYETCVCPMSCRICPLVIHVRYYYFPYVSVRMRAIV